MLGAVVFGHEQQQVAIKAINQLVADAGKPRWDWKPNTGRCRAGRFREAELRSPAVRGLSHHRQQERYAKVGEIKAAVIAAVPQVDGTPKWGAQDIGTQLHNLESRIVRERILNGEPRIDGRDFNTVRPITVKAGLLPRTHGSSLFTRGETQALVTATLGTSRDAQIIDALAGERREPFMLHYNFPPFSVGETGMMGSPKRREIGPRQPRAPRHQQRAADAGRVSVRHPRGVRDSGIERFLIDGFGLRHQPCADGCRRAGEGAGGGRGDGPGAGRRPFSRSSPTSSATRIISATWISRWLVPPTA